jgi:peroxiredoxin
MARMRSWISRAIGVGLAGALLVSCGGAAPGAKSGGGGATAPEFSLPTLDGQQAHLSDYRGKVVLLNFWSTTCDPCMVEMPHLVQLYQQHKDQGFVVLAISADGPESRAQVGTTAHNKNMIFPVLLDEETVVTARYNPKRELPFSVLIGKDGTILQKRNGYTAGDEKTLAAEVEKALSK